nr:type II toxin-antitoxin system ParD family antitoxin [Polymorphobacter sp.]
MPITVSLAEPAARWIDERVAAGDYPDAATYVAELVERDREDAAKLVALKAAIDEGLASGVSDLNFDDILREARVSLVSG